MNANLERSRIDSIGPEWRATVARFRSLGGQGPLRDGDGSVRLWVSLVSVSVSELLRDTPMTFRSVSSREAEMFHPEGELLDPSAATGLEACAESRAVLAWQRSPAFGLSAVLIVFAHRGAFAAYQRVWGGSVRASR